MKKRIVTLVITGVMAAMCLTSVAQENKKAAKARKEVAEAKQELKKAKVDSAVDFLKFKTESDLKIKHNQTRISQLKARKAVDNKTLQKEYDKKVAALDQENKVLKRKINAAGSTTSKMWFSFKEGFNHDMKKLEDAIRNI